LCKLKYRLLFAEVIRDQPPAFFYGVNDLSVGLDEAACASFTRKQHEDNLGRSVVRQLSEESLHIVWEATRWPKSYNDPLDGHEFTDEDMREVKLLAPGLHRFIEHKRGFKNETENV
jgi:hypothetical protein